MNAEQNVKIAAWSLSVVAVALATMAWASDLSWHFGGISTYKLFPLFGLLAFSLMWSHYVASVLRQILKVEKAVLKKYFEVTSWLVLAAIFLHPGLLTYQLWRDGFGWPPGSVTGSYVAPALGWVVVLGEVSFFIFLAYEFHRKFGRRPWWRYVQSASDIAMLAIFYHGLRLGGQLQNGWFRYVWFFYGATLGACLVYKYSKYLSKHQTKSG